MILIFENTQQNKNNYYHANKLRSETTCFDKERLRNLLLLLTRKHILWSSSVLWRYLCNCLFNCNQNAPWDNCLCFTHNILMLKMCVRREWLLSEQTWARDLCRPPKPQTSNGRCPRQGHLWEQARASKLHRSRWEAATSIETGARELLAWVKALVVNVFNQVEFQISPTKCE